jgi:tetratricopeptide (TPR) repeat protein
MLPNEKQAEIHAERAFHLVNEGRFNDAVSELTTAVNHDGRNASSLLLLGELYAMAGHHEAAASFLQRGVREDYANMRGWTMLANTYCQIGGVYLELAMEQIEMALGINPDVDDLHYLKGNVLAQLGDPTGAEAAFKRCLELRPGHAHASRDLQSLTTGA